MIEFFEFSSLFRNIEKELINQVDYKKIFFEEADIVAKNEEKAISFEKFVFISIENKFFSKEKIMRFSNMYDLRVY